MFIVLLKYGFLILFFATAIIGIASLPGWIKIPEYYRKKIFIFLILEVVGAIVIFFKQEFINDTGGIPHYTISDNSWRAYNDSAFIVAPKITISTKDTSITKILSQSSFKKFVYLKNKMASDGMHIMNANNEIVGIITMKQLDEVGLFNSIETAKDEISSSENYTYIRWKKNLTANEKKWSMSGSNLAPFYLQVYDEGVKTKYMIKNTITNEILFSSDSYSKNLFNTDNRIIHFFKHERMYYLIRIAQANLTNHEENYVHVLQIRLNPDLKTE